MHQLIQPDGWPRPKGYSNGMVAEGRLLFVAGQVGWDPKKEGDFPPTFVGQFEQALANVLAVVRAAGGKPEDVCRITFYVVDKHEYLTAGPALSEAYRKHMGRHYPVMAAVQVAGLVEAGAKLELEATAVLPASR